MKKLILAPLFLLSFSLFAQVESKKSAVATRFQQVQHLRSVKQNLATLLEEALLHGVIRLQNEEGIEAVFVLKPSNTLSPELQKEFPNLHSFKGYSPTDFSQKIRLDFNEKGLFAWIKSTRGDYYIQSSEVDKNELIIYSKENYYKAYRPTFTEHTPHPAHDTTKIAKIKTTRAQKPNGGKVRTYRLAISCTGEYAQYHGGSISLALAAISTTVNRINEIFENDFSVQLQLIANMSTILFTNPNTDPYDDDKADMLIDQVQEEIDARIGVANYDIGHIFSTGGGGIAQIASVCGIYKANGVTGSANPIGDPFDIDYVAHEMGHQFGADHTFNSTEGSCTGAREATEAYEPGGGTTIMGYAGICSPHNIQQQSDAYFHVSSIEQIVNFTTSGRGSTCGTLSTNNNTPPQILLPQGGFVIPVSTPFKLSGSATDAEDTLLTYCWEQYNLGPASGPTNPIGNAPIFRSFPPTENPVRYFPTLSSIIANQSSLGELLPSYARDLNFRLTVRDNHPLGGGINFEEIAFSVTDIAGPFRVTSQNTTVNYAVNESVVITWDVATTNQAPVNCSSVTIRLSTDGGISFPHVVAEHTANDGSESIIIPNTITTQGRFMVEADGNVFFNVNAAFFSITAPTTPDFALGITPRTQDVCAPDSFVFVISPVRFAGFSSPISLSIKSVPVGVAHYFTKSSLLSNETSVLVLKTNPQHLAGTYALELEAVSSSLIRSAAFSMISHMGVPLVGVLEKPADNGLSPLRPVFRWSAFADAQSYVLELAQTPSFSDKTVYHSTTSSFYLPSPLEQNSTYYWRVKGQNTCGQSAYTAVSSFLTVDLNCHTFRSTNALPLPNGTSVFNSPLSVGVSGIVADVNVLSIKGIHEWTSDLTFELVSPNGHVVRLLTDVCSGAEGEDFDMGFDDASTAGIAPCPPVGKLRYLPEVALSLFNGEEAFGSWTLRITDEFDFVDKGTLQSWELELCVEQVVGVPAFENEQAFNMEVYPNPAEGELRVLSSDTIEFIRLFDGFGVELLQTDDAILDISALKSGVYFYLVKSSSGEKRGKVMKL